MNAIFWLAALLTVYIYFVVIIVSSLAVWTCQQNYGCFLGFWRCLWTQEDLDKVLHNYQSRFIIIPKQLLPSPPPPPLSTFWLLHHFLRGQNADNLVSLTFFAPQPHGNACFAATPPKAFLRTIGRLGVNKKVWAGAGSKWGWGLRAMGRRKRKKREIGCIMYKSIIN